MIFFTNELIHRSSVMKREMNANKIINEKFLIIKFSIVYRSKATINQFIVLSKMKLSIEETRTLSSYRHSFALSLTLQHRTCRKKNQSVCDTTICGWMKLSTELVWLLLSFSLMAAGDIVVRTTTGCYTKNFYQRPIPSFFVNEVGTMHDGKRHRTIMMNCLEGALYELFPHIRSIILLFCFGILGEFVLCLPYEQHAVRRQWLKWWLIVHYINKIDYTNEPFDWSIINGMKSSMGCYEEHAIASVYIYFWCCHFLYYVKNEVFDTRKAYVVMQYLKCNRL